MPSLREAQRRYVQHYLEVAERAQPELRGADQLVWLERLDLELPNLRATLDWATAGGDLELGVRLGGATTLFWYMRGYLAEGRARLEALLAARPPPQRTLALARVLGGAGILAFEQGHYQAARALHQEALQIRRDLGDRTATAFSLHNLGAVAQLTGDIDVARGYYEESVALKRELGDSQTLGLTLNALGDTAFAQRDLLIARAHYEEAVALGEESGNLWSLGAPLTNLGSLAQERGEFEVALAFHQRSLAVLRQVGDTVGIAQVHLNLGRRTMRQGDHLAAEARLRESLAGLSESGSTSGAIEALEAFAELLVAHHREAQSVRLLAVAAAQRQHLGYALLFPEEQHVRATGDRARQTLGEVEFDRIWRAAEGASLKDTVTEVVARVAPSSAGTP